MGERDEAVHDNQENWDDRAEAHIDSGAYGDLDEFVADHQAVSSVVIRDLEVLGPHVPDGSVQGLSLLHLQCHIGTDTISWARLGAKDVHGLDFSANALKYARDLTERAGERITYVRADARKAAEALPGKRFDVIVTSVGTVTWLPDLADWAYSIAALLNPGGVFMIRDSHPLLFA